MTVTAYHGDTIIAQWQGHILWTGTIEDGGNIYAGEVHGRRIVWRSRTIPDALRFKIQEDGSGGLDLAEWLSSNATRFVVFIWQGYGSEIGTGRPLSSGSGVRAGQSNGVQPARDGSGSAGAVERPRGAGEAGTTGAGRRGSGSGSLARSGDPCGQLGGGPSGQRGGASAEDGGVADAWSPTTWGGRYGDSEGARGGDGERGKAGIRGAWASLVHTPQRVIDDAFAEALRRDPERRRRWVVLVDGQHDQLRRVQRAARRYGVEVTIVVDIVHVLEYLWRAAYAFHAEAPRRRRRGCVTGCSLC